MSETIALSAGLSATTETHAFSTGWPHIRVELLALGMPAEDVGLIDATMRDWLPPGTPESMETEAERRTRFERLSAADDVQRLAAAAAWKQFEEARGLDTPMLIRRRHALSRFPLFVSGRATVPLASERQVRTLLPRLSQRS